MLTARCPACGNPTSISESVCHGCGNSLTAETDAGSQRQQSGVTDKLTACPACDHVCSRAALSCPNCGHPFQPQAVVNAITVDSINVNRRSDVGPEPRWRSKGLIVALGTVVLVAALAAIYLFFRPPRQVELKGEVFIVTKGAQNFKLGLVEVTAFPEATVKPFIENKLAAINLEFSRYESTKQATGKQIEQAQQAYGEAKVAYDALNAKYVAAKSTADKAKENADEMTTSLSYGSAEDEAALEATNKEANKTKQQAAQLALQLESKRKEVETKEGELSAAKSATTNGLLRVMKLLTNEALSEGLPSDGTKVVTNSEGQFSMSLPTGRKYVLAARAQRRVFDSTEEYYWLVWVPLEGQETKYVMLTNKNLMGENSSDTVFKTKDLIPTGITKN